MDLDGRFTYVSPAVEALTGYSRSEVLRSGMGDVVESGSGLPIGALLVAALQKPPSERIGSMMLEARQLHKSGETIHAEVNATWILGDDGVPIGVQGITRDLTERKRAEEEQRKLTQLIENSNDFIGLARPDGSVRYLNNAGLYARRAGSF